MRTIVVPKIRVRGRARFCAGLALLALATIIYAEPARACACCADAGYRFEMTGAVEPYEQDVLEALRFDERAALATRELDVEGLPLPSYDDSQDFFGYKMKTVFEADRWTFTLSDSGTPQGTIVFQVPATLEQFVVDPRDTGRHARAGGPVLYKEWRLKGSVVVDGKTRAPASLILHGRGNACSSEADFGHWTLDVEGGGVRFMLIGDLVRS